MKKTTKRGAYKPAQKRAMGNRRRPFVETLRQQAGYGVPGSSTSQRLVLTSRLTNLQLANIPGSASPDGGSNAPASGTADVVACGPEITAFNIVTPDIAFLKTSDAVTYRQNSDSGLIKGDTCFYRMLTTKIQMNFPQAQYSIARPFRIYVYQVWVKTPLNLTQYTTPARADPTKAQIEGHITNACREWFDQKQDIFQFHELKDGVNVKVIKRIKVNVNKNAQLQYAPVSNQGLANPTEGGLQPGPGNSGLECWFRSFTWHYNRKQNFEFTSNPSGPDNKHDLYLNNGWFPALIIYNPDYTHQGREAQVGVADNLLPSLVKVSHNSCLWYTDS